MATIKAAQVDIQSSAPVSAFGTGTIDGKTGGKDDEDDSDDKHRKKMSERLEALRESYASETELLNKKIKDESDLINEAEVQQLADNQAALSQKLIDDEEYQQNKLAIENDFRELRLAAEQEYNEQLQEIERARVEESGSLLEQLKQNIEDTTMTFSELWTGAFDSFVMGFSDSVANSIVEGESFGKSMEQVGKTMAKAMISSLVQIGAQRMTLFLMEKTLGAATNGAYAAAVAGESAAAVSMAGLNAFSSTAAIPVVGPAMAPAAAAAAVAAATPFATAATTAAAAVTGARALGGEVKAGSTYLVGERGAELFVPQADGQITSHDKLAAAVRGGGKSGGVSAVTLAPSIVVESGASQAGDEFLAENIAAQVFNMVLNDANEGGILSRALGVR